MHRYASRLERTNRCLRIQGRYYYTTCTHRNVPVHHCLFLSCRHFVPTVALSSTKDTARRLAGKVAANGRAQVGTTAFTGQAIHNKCRKYSSSVRVRRMMNGSGGFYLIRSSRVCAALGAEVIRWESTMAVQTDENTLLSTKLLRVHGRSQYSRICRHRPQEFQSERRSCTSLRFGEALSAQSLIGLTA